MSELPKPNDFTHAQYNRDDAVKGLTEYYLNLTRMAYIPASYIDFPPPSGWSDAELDVGALRALRRSETVIDLLRHLPYPRQMTDGPRPGPWDVAPHSKAVRYLRHMGDFSKWSDRGDAGLAELAALPLSETPAGPMDLPPDVVALTHGARWLPTTTTRPYWWILDCVKGIVSPFREECYNVSQVPRNKPWRTVQSYTAAEFFQRAVADLGQGLVPIPPTEDLDAAILEAPFSRTEALQIYASHGWPSAGEFRHDECIVALQDYRRRMQELERRLAQEDDPEDEDYQMEDSDDEMSQGEDEVSDLANAVVDMDVEAEDLKAEVAALRADMLAEQRARSDRMHYGSVPFEWVDSE